MAGPPRSCRRPPRMKWRPSAGGSLSKAGACACSRLKTSMGSGAMLCTAPSGPRPRTHSCCCTGSACRQAIHRRWPAAGRCGTVRSSTTADGTARRSAAGPGTPRSPGSRFPRSGTSTCSVVSSTSGRQGRSRMTGWPMPSLLSAAHVGRTGHGRYTAPIRAGHGFAWSRADRVGGPPRAPFGSFGSFGSFDGGITTTTCDGAVPVHLRAFGPFAAMGLPEDRGCHDRDDSHGSRVRHTSND